ncbi:MAG: hypothetical protein ACOC8K_05275 [Gemmatimonadota bacterium]
MPNLGNRRQAEGDPGHGGRDVPGPAPAQPPGSLQGPGRAVLLPLCAVLLACGPNHHLAEYDFRDATVAVVPVPAPNLDVFSDLDLSVDPTDFLGTAVRVGTGLAREAALDDFRTRADSAARVVDVPARIANRTLEGAVRYLRAEPESDEARPDYEFELRIDTFGFVADDWDSGAYLSLEGDLLLLDGATGRIVWNTHVTATNPVQSTSVRSNAPGVGNVATAIALNRMSRQEIEKELEVLADITADALLDQLREDLDEAREG